MAEETKTIEVSLLGRSYQFACADGESEALMRAATHLDAKMNEIKRVGKVNNTERIAVMVALNAVHELLSMKIGGGFDLGQAKRRIASIEATLDTALAQQEKLF